MSAASPGAVLPVINMFWIGGSLGLLEQLSMLSFMAHGHQVRLFTYGDVAGIPDGISHRDAESVMPFELAGSLRYRKGSYGLAANYFRLVLMQQGLGIWADADLICLRPITIESPCLFGWEHEGSINNAILYLEPGSPITRDILKAFVPNSIPSWIDFNRKRQLWMKRLVGKTLALPDHRFATFGPIALTALARKYGVVHLAAPIDVYYPNPYGRRAEPFKPDTVLESFIAEESKTLHLWNTGLAEFVGTRPVATSAIGRLLTQYGL